MLTSKNNYRNSQTLPKSNNTTSIIESEAKFPAEPTNGPQGVTVVGIGALNSFFDRLAPDTGMKFVVVTWLHPEHESHMSELLQSHTQMPTGQAMTKVKVEFNKPRGGRSLVDSLFRCLASENRESIAISTEEWNNHVQIAVSAGGNGFRSDTVMDLQKSTGGLVRIPHQLNLRACHPQVRSKPGKGTRVSINIPIMQGTT